MAQQTLDAVIESQNWLDRIADPLQSNVREILGRGPAGSRLRSFLHGTWLGHPLHPALTDVPVGAWTAALILDVLSYGEPRALNKGADLSIGIGLAGAVAAATTGVADWSHTSNGSRRLGLVHALSNTAAALLYGASLVQRASGNRSLGRGLAFLGYGAVSFGAYIGGHLSYRCGVGVDHTAFQALPGDFVDVLPSQEIQEGQMRRASVNGTPVLLVRRDGQIYAIANTCSHLGGPLDEGSLEGNCVTCPWHGSQFDVTTGEVLSGPAAHPEMKLDVRVVEGRVQVRQTEPGC